MKKLLCFGHRGAAGHAPENTLTSVETAIALGADWIEIDVYLVDGELVVFHDARLERTTNGQGYLEKQSLDYLRTLDAGEGERIPLLREVLERVDHRVGINIELKGAHTAAATARQLDLYLSASGGNWEQFLISSFNHHELRLVKQLRPQLRTGVLIYCLPLDYARMAEALGAYSIHPSCEFLNRSLVIDAHQRGLKVFPYTVNDEETLAHMKALEVDGVFTDYPELVSGVGRG